MFEQQPLPEDAATPDDAYTKYQPMRYGMLRRRVMRIPSGNPMLANSVQVVV